VNDVAVPHARERCSILALAVALAAWIVPGLGHLLLRRWERAVLLFISIGGLALAGFLLRGIVFPVHVGEFRSDPLSFLGGLGDAGSGAFYFLVRAFGAASADVSRAAGDYGTRFIAAAGVANYLGVADAWKIAIGLKE